MPAARLKLPRGSWKLRSSSSTMKSKDSETRSRAFQLTQVTRWPSCMPRSHDLKRNMLKTCLLSRRSTLRRRPSLRVNLSSTWLPSLPTMSSSFKSWASSKTRKENKLEPNFRLESMSFSAKSRTRNRIWGLRVSAVKRNSSPGSPS